MKTALLLAAIFLTAGCSKQSDTRFAQLEQRTAALEDKLSKTQDYALALENGQKVNDEIVRILAQAGTEERLTKTERLVELLDKKIEITAALIKAERAERELVERKPK